MKLSYYFVLLVLLGFSITIFADSENENTKRTTEQLKNTEPKQKINKRGRIKTLKEFIPSEEVSADKPVAFPSDI